MKYPNKVSYNGNTLIDLTADTVTPDKLLLGVTAHNAKGEVIVGTLNINDLIHHTIRKHAYTGDCVGSFTNK